MQGPLFVQPLVGGLALLWREQLKEGTVLGPLFVQPLVGGPALAFALRCFAITLGFVVLSAWIYFLGFVVLSAWIRSLGFVVRSACGSLLLA